MKKTDSRVGRLKSDGDAKPLQMASVANSATNEAETGNPTPKPGLNVHHLKRISESQPTAWEGVTPNGNLVHIAYRFGMLTVEVGVPRAARPGAIAWRTVAEFNPHLVEAEFDGQSKRDPYATRIMAERAAVAEIRGSNAADMDSVARRTNGSAADMLLNRGRLIIRDGQLIEWMELRNANLARLIKQRLAGGSMQVHVSSWG